MRSFKAPSSLPNFGRSFTSIERDVKRLRLSFKLTR